MDEHKAKLVPPMFEAHAAFGRFGWRLLASALRAKGSRTVFGPRRMSTNVKMEWSGRRDYLAFGELCHLAGARSLSRFARGSRTEVRTSPAGL